MIIKHPSQYPTDEIGCDKCGKKPRTSNYKINKKTGEVLCSTCKSKTKGKKK